MLHRNQEEIRKGLVCKQSCEVLKCIWHTRGKGKENWFLSILKWKVLEKLKHYPLPQNQTPNTSPPKKNHLQTNPNKQTAPQTKQKQPLTPMQNRVHNLKSISYQYGKKKQALDHYTLN